MRSFRFRVLGLFAALAAPALGGSVALAQGTPIFTEDQKILASDGAAGDQLGYSVGVSDDLLIVSAYLTDGPGGVDSGAAYILRFDNSEWVEEAKLLPPTGIYEGRFGRSVAIYDDIAVVCSDTDSDPNHPNGAVYIYRIDGEDWEFEAKYGSGENSGWGFGQSLAAHDDLIVIGDVTDNTSGLGVGAATVLRYNGNSWEFEAKLYGSTNVDDQGWSVATDGQQILLGSNDGDEDNYVFVFRWTGSAWVQDATVGYSYGGDWYGRSVDIMGNLAVVGCSSDYYDNAIGKVYIYTSSGAPNYVWTQAAVIQASDLQIGDYFGEAVAIADEHTIIVQAKGHELDGYGNSTLYVFHEIDGVWIEKGRLTTSDTGDHFGHLASPTLSADGGHVVVGAPREDNQNGVDAGSAFYFDISCPGDLNGDLVVDQSDLGTLLASYGVDDGGDVDGDGDTDQADLGQLLSVYGGVCA